LEDVDKSLKAREECIKMLGFYLEGAQNRMKMQADKHITKKELQIGDFVYVK